MSIYRLKKMNTCELPYCSVTYRKNKCYERYSNTHYGQYTIKYKSFPDLSETSKCGKIFKTEEKLKEHQLLVHPQMFNNVDWLICSYPDCNFKTKLLKSFKTHRFVHSRPFKCIECSRAFDRRYLLEYHINTHTRKYLFHCHWPGCKIRSYSRRCIIEHFSLCHRPYRDQTLICSCCKSK